MLPWLLVLVVVCFVVTGCGRKAESEPKQVAATSQVDAFEQRRQGWVLLDGAAESLEEAFAEAQRVERELQSREARDAISDALERVDSAGASISDALDDQPDAALFRSSPSGFEAKRKMASDATFDAILDLRDAIGILNGLEGLPQADSNLLEPLLKLMDVALHDLGDALVEFGGEVDVDRAAEAGGSSER